MSLATQRHFARPLAAALAILSAWGLGACAASDREPAAQTLTVFAASSLKVPFQELATTFEADHPGVRVSFNFAGSTDLVAQLKEGATAQVLATADSTSMQGAAEEGLLDGEAEVFATNHLVIAVPADNPAGISTFADLARTGTRLVECAPDVPCGRLAGQVADAAGVTLHPVSEESAVADVLAKVVSGEADAGLVYASDAVTARDAVTAIEIPQADAFRNAYPIAVAASAGELSAAAQDFQALVLSDQGHAVLARAGFGQP
jgi:molybdate transport system substrate-binding protein